MFAYSTCWQILKDHYILTQEIIDGSDYNVINHVIFGAKFCVLWCYHLVVYGRDARTCELRSTCATRQVKSKIINVNIIKPMV